MRRTTRLSMLVLTTLVASTACARSEADNLVIISFDTTRRDHLSLYGYERDTTPTLVRLAERGATFDQAIAQQNRTLPSHTSMLTGLYPHQHRALSNEHILSSAQATLAEVLLLEGFRTGAFVSGYPLDADWGVDQGFEDYDDRIDRMGRRGELTEAAARDWLERLESGRRYFLFVHFFDAHGPYETPGGELAFRSERPGPRLRGPDVPPYQRLRRPDGRRFNRLNDYVDRYDTLIRYQDDMVERLLGAIDLDHTIVVVIADHGESLDERTRKLNHGAALYDEETRIPLIIAGAGLPASRIGVTVETVDLMPTVLDLLGVAQPEGVFTSGRSLAAMIREGGDGGDAAGRIAFSSSVAEPHRFDDRGYQIDTLRQIQSARDGLWKLIVYPGIEQDYVELYDLTADPLEQTDVAARHPEVRDRLLAAIEAWNPTYGEPVPLTNISDEERERLRALGYIR